MGPDCGTAILDGIPLGFANAVRAGRLGLIGASGTGLQQVACLVDARGEGISDAIGVGGRDLDAAIGGIMMRSALERMARYALKLSRRTGALHRQPPPADFPPGAGATTLWLSLH